MGDNDRMTGGDGAGRATRRRWAVAALAALLLLAAGLVQVVLESQGAFLPLTVTVLLSVAVVAATAWWAFTTRRVWKRWLNLAIAGLVVLNALVGMVTFGVAQVAGTLAIAGGALGYAVAARRALRPAGLWTAARTPPAGPRRSPSGDLPSRPWLLVNPRSGNGKAAKVGLVDAARARGVQVHVLAPGDDPAALARQALADGADAVGVAGGDGSLGLVAAVAMEADVPFACVPAGTRNHFAADLGLDRADPLAALAAFAGGERRIDVATVGDRVFMNNVSLGAYADMVAEPGYRAGKLATAHAVLPGALRGERQLLRVDLPDLTGGRPSDVLMLLIANNRYELRGTRERLDTGVLQVSALRARTGAALAGLAASLAARRSSRGPGWTQWTTTALRVEAALPEVPAGIDGEAASLAPPLEFRVLPLALRVLVPPDLAPVAPRVRLQSWTTVLRLLRVATGRGR
jgi:diacylglycerol kinase family enzyme